MSQNDIDLLDIRLLRLFDAIHATGSITRAADALDLSQPTVSIGLGRLRRHFGDPLFVRTPDGMLATPLADSLIGAIRDALQALRQVSEWRNTFDPCSSSRGFVIAMTDASHITLLPELLSAAFEIAPGIQLEVTRIDDRLPASLQSGDVDLALGLVPSLESGFYQQKLFEQDWICLARQGHPQLTRGLSLRTYQAAAHIGIVYGTGQLLLEKALEVHGIDRRIVLRLPGFLGLSSILAGSDLIATLPRHIGSTLAKLGGLAIHECPFAIDGFFVKQHWHARYHKDPANQWLRTLCARVFTKQPERS
jgi:DNA-binding transcriptional LysR family regulator